MIKNDAAMCEYADSFTQFMDQGGLAATYAYDVLSVQYVDQARMTPVPEQELKRLLEQAQPKIVISGDNADQTRNLVNTIFPDLQDVLIVKEPFNRLHGPALCWRSLNPGFPSNKLLFQKTRQNFTFF